MAGMISLLPPLWRELSKTALEIMLINADQLLEILRKRSV
jgi:hypothetical protein